jgi:hypothetical protein
VDRGDAITTVGIRRGQWVKRLIYQVRAASAFSAPCSVPIGEDAVRIEAGQHADREVEGDRMTRSGPGRFLD